MSFDLHHRLHACLERTIASAPDAAASTTVVIITARDEAPTIVATLAALRVAFPLAQLVLGDDGSRDATVELARERAVEVVGDGRRRGKGGAASAAARRALALGGESAVYVLCDGDLGASASLLRQLRDAVVRGDGDLAIASFERRSGGGFGIALGFARWLVRRCCQVELVAPISGQRALRGTTLARALPFARGYGIELAMTIDTLRDGGTVVEIPLDLEHRATRRNLAGFSHRARQLIAFIAVGAGRRIPPGA
jgi:glycosyltransferase involved in cell wall biosynthesis